MRRADTWIVANRMDQLPEFFCKAPPLELPESPEELGACMLGLGRFDPETGVVEEACHI